MYEVDFMISSHRDIESYGVQTLLTTFQAHSIQSYNELIESGRGKGQRGVILDMLTKGSQRSFPIKQYNARISELRERGICISAKRDEEGWIFTLMPTSHIFNIMNECQCCGFRVKEK